MPSSERLYDIGIRTKIDQADEAGPKTPGKRTALRNYLPA